MNEIIGLITEDFIFPGEDALCCFVLLPNLRSVCSIVFLSLAFHSTVG